MDIRERIKREAKQKKVTLNYLAKRCGVTPQTFHRKLSGDITMDMETLQKIAQLLDVTVGYLLGEVQVIKSEVAEVRVYDLVSGQLVAKGVQLMPLSILTGETIMVKDGESTWNRRG